MCLSTFILDEVAGVLVRKFGWGEERAAEAIRVLRISATVIEPVIRLQVIEGGHADNRILECAASADADFVVTGDRRHLLPIVSYEGIRIQNAPRFLSELEG